MIVLLLYPLFNYLALASTIIDIQPSKDESTFLLSDNGKDKELASNSNKKEKDEIIDSLPNIKIDLEFNSERTKKISEFLNERYLEKLDPIGEMIGGYEHEPQPLVYLYTKVMKRFEEYEGIDSLDFDDPTFANKFGLLLLKREIKFIREDWLFRTDIKKLLFKWLIYMRERFANNDGEFERISKDMEPFVSKFFENELNIQLNFNIKDMELRNDHSFNELLKIEFLENPHLFPIFASMIRSFYDDSGMQVMTCQELETKYFGIGGFNSKVILKYLMTIHDPQGGLRECILKKDDHVSRLNVISKESISEYLVDLESKGPRYLEIPSTEYLDIHALEFLLQTNKQIVISDRHNFFYLSGRLYESNLLNMNNLNRLVIFRSRDYDDSNQEIVKRLLNLYKNDTWMISKADIERCDNYLKRFDEIDNNVNSQIDTIKENGENDTITT